MSRQNVFVTVLLAVASTFSVTAWGQCQGGGQRGGQSTSIQGAFPSQTAGFNNQYSPQAFYQQAAMQQAYVQQQRAILQQQFALVQAQRREANRQQRLASATARREKKAKAQSQYASLQKSPKIAMTEK